MTPRRGLPASSTFFLLLAAACAFPASADDADDLKALGWTPGAVAPSCEMVQPELDAARTVWLSVHDPSAIPVPAFRCGASSVALPVVPDSGLLRRDDTAGGRVVWNLQSFGRVRGSAAAIVVDFPPFAPPRSTAAPTSPATLYGKPMTLPPRPVRDPAMTGRASKYNRVPEPLARPTPAELTAAALEGLLTDDGFAATADGGARWIRLDVAGRNSRLRFALDTNRIFGGDGRLLVAPRALQLDAETHVFAVDSRTLAVTSLGRPAPPDAGHWLRVTDARESGGAVEVLVCVDEITRLGFSSPYGLLAVHQGGAWTFPERYFTPAPAGTYPELRFDEADPSRVLLVTGASAASRPLRTAVAP